MGYLIRNTTILRKTDGWRIETGVDLQIATGMIAACGPALEPGEASDEIIDGRDLLLVPGLVNAHVHSAEVLSRGLATMCDLSGWLARALPPIDQLSARDIELAVRLCASNCIRSGVTTIVDHFRQMPASLAAGETAARAWESTGVRATVALMVRDGAAASGLATDAEHAGAPPETGECLRLCDDWIGRQSATGMVRRALGPSAPARCSEALLLGIAEIGRKREAPVHMHVDETSDQANLARELFGASSVGVLQRCGLLGPMVSLAHCVHVGADDIAMIAESGTTVIHCPVANMRLGSGIAPIRELLAAGANVALASDGAASNDSQSMTEAMKLAFLASRVRASPEDRISVDDVLDMACRPHARLFLGADERPIGELGAGARADIAAFDLNDPLLAPLHDGASQMVLGGGSLRARHVWIDGEMVLKDRVNMTCCEADLMREARAWTKRRCGGGIG